MRYPLKEFIEIDAKPNRMGLTAVRVWEDTPVVQDSESYDPNPDGQTCASLYVVGNEYGTLCLVFARCEQDALDDAADSGNLDSERVSDEDMNEYYHADEEGITRLGNAGEPFRSESLWIAELPVPTFSLFALIQESARQLANLPKGDDDAKP